MSMRFTNQGTTTRMIMLQLEQGPKKFYHIHEALQVIEKHNLYNRLNRMVKQGYLKRIKDSYYLIRH